MGDQQHPTFNLKLRDKWMGWEWGVGCVHFMWTAALTTDKYDYSL